MWQNENLQTKAEPCFKHHTPAHDQHHQQERLSSAAGSISSGPFSLASLDRKSCPRKRTCLPSFWAEKSSGSQSPDFEQVCTNSAMESTHSRQEGAVAFAASMMPPMALSSKPPPFQRSKMNDIRAPTADAESMLDSVRHTMSGHFSDKSMYTYICM